MPHSPEAVANEFLERALEDGTALTPMHLQKLVYIAHGWNLAIQDEPLTNEPPEAWRFGPVYPSLYDNTKRYGADRVPELIRKNNWAGSEKIRGEPVRENFAKRERRVLDKVYREYADLEAFQLSALTHAEGTPWTETYVAGQNRRIKNGAIKRHFRAIAAGQVV